MKAYRFLKLLSQNAPKFWNHADHKVQYVAILSSNNKLMVREVQAGVRKVVRKMEKKYSGAKVEQALVLA